MPNVPSGERLRQLAPGAEEQTIPGRDRIAGKDHSGLHVLQADMGHGSICGVASYTAPITTSPGSTRRRPGNGSCRQLASGGPGILIGRRAAKLEPEGRPAEPLSGE